VKGATGPQLRLAWRIAFSRDVSQRWRQMTVVTGTFLAVLAALVSVACVTASIAAQDRADARTPVLAQEGQPGLSMVVRGEIWEGRQFPVVWVYGGAEAPIPPGLDRLPEPGTAAVSPAIAANPQALKGLGFDVSSAGSGADGAIGDEGLRARSEWLVYIAPPEGRTLGADGNIFTVASFGTTSLAQPQLSFETDPATPPPGTATALVALTLIIPSVLLLLLSAAAPSDLRRGRQRVLGLLGVSRARVFMIGALETALLASVGSVVAVALWVGLLDRVQTLPGAGVRLVDGAFALPWWLVVATVSVSVAGAASWGGRSHDVTIDARTPRRWRRLLRLGVRPERRLLPFGAGVILVLLGRVLPGAASQLLAIAGLVVILASFGMAMIWAVEKVGDMLARRARPEAWLAGRRLASSPKDLARPAIVIGMLVCLVGAGAGFREQLTGSVNLSQAGSTTAMMMSWRDPRPGDVETIGQALPSLGVAPIISLDSGAEVWFDSCEGIARAVDVADCGEADVNRPALEDMFTQIFGMSARVGPAPDYPADTYAPDVLVVGEIDHDGADVWAALNHRLPAVNLDAASTQLAPPLAVGWLSAGIGGAGVLLFAAALLVLGGRALALTEEDSVLLRIGLDGSQVRKVQRLTLVLPLWSSVIIGAAAAQFFTWASTDAHLTSPATGMIAATGGIMIVVSTGASALVLRQQHRRLRASSQG